MVGLEKEEKRHRTVLKTVRLSPALDATLARKAESKGIGKNALIVSILNKYVEWDSVVEELGYASVPIEMVSSLIRNLDKDTAFSIAKQVSKSVASSLPLWFGSSSLNNLLMYFETAQKYRGAWVQHRTEKQGNTIKIIVYQPFSEIGAAWERGFLTGLVEGVLGYPPKIIQHANSIEAVIEVKNGM